jgi:anti-sigma-K factor RskA
MQLVRRADADAFAVVYERHSSSAYALAYRMTGTRGAAARRSSCRPRGPEPTSRRAGATAAGTVDLAATGAASAAHAHLTIEDGRATITADHLPQPPKGRVYQVWLKPRDGRPQPTSSLFVPRADGTAEVAVPATAADMDLVLVSTEPPGGSPAPTTAPVLTAKIQS